MSTKEEIKRMAEENLEFFISLVHPDRVLGHVHKDIISWWNREEAKSHQLLLLPRDHQKSALVAYRVAWEITRNPAVRIIYISATSNLASNQMFFIKNILTNPIYRYYWPEMIKTKESERTKWTSEQIIVDHPLRTKENVRDATIFIGGLTTVVTGLHCDVLVLDDVVIDDNSRDKTSREDVSNRVSYLASVLGTEGSCWVTGTRYHPDDLYNTFIETLWETYDEDGNETGSSYLYEVFERQVEDRGDGSGQFLWPRTQRYDGKWFGFNREILSKKKAQYTDLGKFRAQYYNNPNSLENANISPDYFQYYDRNFLKRDRGNWYFKDRRLNLAAAVDFAFSTRKEADYSCIAVLGIDSEYNVYILDLVRFKTSSIVDYFDNILKLHTKWGFRKLRAEVTVAQQAIVNELKNNYIRPHGLALSVDEYRPQARQGTKEERMEATLNPKYHNRQVWHFRGGACELLEEELIAIKPKHDDIKDAVTSAMDILVPPSSNTHFSRSNNSNNVYDLYHARFGGVA